jgi:hypothetical protein
LFDRRGLALQRNPSRRQSGIKAPVEVYHKRRAAFGDDGIDCRIGNDRGVHPDRSAVAARQALGRGRIDIDDRAEVRPEMGRQYSPQEWLRAAVPNRQKLMMTGPSAIIAG